MELSEGNNIYVKRRNYNYLEGILSVKWVRSLFYRVIDKMGLKFKVGVMGISWKVNLDVRVGWYGI